MKFSSNYLTFLWLFGDRLLLGSSFGRDKGHINGIGFEEVEQLCHRGLARVQTARGTHDRDALVLGCKCLKEENDVWLEGEVDLSCLVDDFDETFLRAVSRSVVGQSHSTDGTFAEK